MSESNPQEVNPSLEVDGSDSEVECIFDSRESVASDEIEFIEVVTNNELKTQTNEICLVKKYEIEMSESNPQKVNLSFDVDGSDSGVECILESRESVASDDIEFIEVVTNNELKTQTDKICLVKNSVIEMSESNPQKVNLSFDVDGSDSEVECISDSRESVASDEIEIIEVVTNKEVKTQTDKMDIREHIECLKGLKDLRFKILSVPDKMNFKLDEFVYEDIPESYYRLILGMIADSKDRQNVINKKLTPEFIIEVLDKVMSEVWKSAQKAYHDWEQTFKSKRTVADSYKQDLDMFEQLIATFPKESEEEIADETVIT